MESPRDVQTELIAVCPTIELSGHRRQAIRPGPVKMHRVPPALAWWPAVGAPLERGVRPHLVDIAASTFFWSTNRSKSPIALVTS